MKSFLKRLIKLFTDRKIWVRQIIVTTASAAVAWEAGNLAYKSGGLVAAIVAVLTVRISLYRSVREGLAQIIGTAFGAAVAFASLSLIHLGIVTVAVTVLFAFVIARALKMSESAAINVPITALIVIGPGLSESTAYHRLLSTIIGAAIAIPFSYFSHPSTPEGRTVEKISRAGRDAAKLLGAMAEGVLATYTLEEAGEWLAKARELIEEIPSLRLQAYEARRYARWIPTAHMDVAEELQRRAIAFEHVIVQVRTIARTLFDISVEGGLPDDICRPIGLALSTSSYAITAKLENVKNGKPFSTKTADELHLIAYELAENLISHKNIVDQTQIVKAISLVTNIERIADSLDETAPAITEVDTPQLAESEGIISLLPVETSVKFSKRITSKIKNLFTAS